MQITRAYKTELDPNNAQVAAFERNIAAGRFVYNWALEDRKRLYEATGKGSNKYAQKRYFNAIKGECFPWVNDADYKVVEQAFDNLDLAFKSFFRRVKRGETPGYPKFKSRHAPNQSYITRGSVHIEAGRVKLPKIGWVRLKERGYLPEDGTCKLFFVTISERAGRWYISAQVEIEGPDPEPATGEPIGIDRGIREMAVVSDGRRFENPKPLGKEQRKVSRLQRELARRQRGGANYNKTKEKLARLHARIADIRQDATHKATSAIVKADPKPATIVLEDLDLLAMQQDRWVAKQAADSAMGEFARQIKYKAQWNGVDVVIAPREFASSKICSACGHVKENLGPSIKTWTCERCGARHDRDLNAARNLAALAPTPPCPE